MKSVLRIIVSVQAIFGNNDFSRLELSRSALLQNFRYFRSKLRPSTEMLVLVKANGYGHGAVEMAAMLQQAGADYLAVALPIEGVELRKAGISMPILVLTAGTDWYEQIVRYRLEPGIPNSYSLAKFREVLAQMGQSNYPVHIKLDTGMHRLGFMPGEIDGLCNELVKMPEITVRSIYSHLAAAEDPEEDKFTLNQIALYKKGAETITSALGYKPMYHILNSAGIERFPQYQFDMVRLGIGIYGVSCLPGVELAPVASLKCKILQIKTLTPEDGTIGYGRHGHVSPEGTVIATIPVGYADGIDRRLGQGRATFSVCGCRVPTIGNICMDMCMLDVTGTPAKVGDVVTIFGEDPTAAELACILDTIPYEVMTRLPRRVDRVVVK